MKKKCILALVLGAAFMAQGCGYTEGTDAVVTVVDATPTPEPTEAPEPTATPKPDNSEAVQAVIDKIRCIDHHLILVAYRILVVNSNQCIQHILRTGCRNVLQ